MKKLKEISNFLKVTMSLAFGLMGTVIFVSSLLKGNVQMAVLGMCFLIYSDTIWLYYKDSIRSKKND